MTARTFSFALCLLAAPTAMAQTPPAEPEAGSTPAAAETPPPAAGADTAAPAEAAPADEAPAPKKEAPKAPVVTVTKKGMGTRIQIQVFYGDAPKESAQKVIESAFGEVKRIEGLMSEWQSGSEISKINSKAGTGEAIPVSAETLAVLKKGKEVSTLSKGAFAMTWSVLSSIWDFRQGESDVKKIPDAIKAQDKTGLIDDSKLELDEEKKTAKLTGKGMSLGMGAIAKGYAIDRALKVLAEGGFPNALVFAGGDIGVVGSKGDKPWFIGIQDPRARGYFATVPVRDEAVVTSGDYERYFEVDGKRYHHILDPRTGYPAVGVRSVTVVAKDAMTADAFATAVFILGPTEGMKLVEEQAGIEAVIVDAENNISMSTNLRNRVRVLRAPTS